MHFYLHPNPTTHSLVQPSTVLLVKKMWLELSFIPSMLFEHWEKILLLTTSAVLFMVIFTTILKYLHHHLVVMRGRAAWDQEGDEGLLWQWIGLESGERGTLNSEG